MPNPNNGLKAITLIFFYCFKAIALPTAGKVLSADSFTPQCPIAGDYDYDHDVDGNDYLTWQREFGKTNSPADGNKNKSVDAADYTVWRNNYGSLCVTDPTLIGSINRLVSFYPNPTNDDLKIFKSYSATGCNLDLAAEWNYSHWGATVNLTPIAWHDDARWGNPQVCGPTLGRGIAITKHHVLAHHQHGTESPGWSLQFLDRQGRVVSRQTAWEYEVDSSGLWRILWLNEPLPEDMVAPMPTADSDIRGKPIAHLNQFHELRLRYVNNQTQNYSWVPAFNGSVDPDPIRQKYYRAVIGGDSGKPLFAIVGTEMVPLSFWWTTGGGSSVVYDQVSILMAVDKLTMRKGKDPTILRPRLLKVY